AAGIAHEVNNPLTAILLAAQSALESTNKANRQKYMKQCLEGIVKDAGRCEQIVSSVLQFARSGTAKKGPADLPKIIQRAVDLTQAYADEKGASIELQLEDNLPLIALNPGQMEQVFANLIRNAVESGERGNRVSVAVKRTAQTVRILVADKGRGMSDEQRNRLFDPFYTTREREGGTGLGLSIVHGIVLAHGGKIDVDSRLGQGTTMTIELPLPKSHQHSP
ncbi:MAG: HAMP domain-containing histidine kinase, partial [Planctomycetes bacterium]|nr:HAMP domain-containing histidine kinase [Planctomycetota bacterium]